MLNVVTPVQSYNTLLTAAHLAEVSDGVIRLENEVLHSLCTRAHNIARPSFHVSSNPPSRLRADLLCVRACICVGIGHAWATFCGVKTHGHFEYVSWRLVSVSVASSSHLPAPPLFSHRLMHSLAALLVLHYLPFIFLYTCHCSPSPQDMNAVAARALAAVMLPARHRPASPAALAAATHTTPTSAALAAKAAARGRGGWSPVAQPPPGSPSVMGGGAVTSGSGVRMMSDLVHHVCAHPMYRMLSLRALPQVRTAGRL